MHSDLNPGGKRLWVQAHFFHFLQQACGTLGHIQLHSISLPLSYSEELFSDLLAFGRNSQKTLSSSSTKWSYVDNGSPSWYQSVVTYSRIAHWPETPSWPKTQGEHDNKKNFHSWRSTWNKVSWSWVRSHAISFIPLGFFSLPWHFTRLTLLICHLMSQRWMQMHKSIIKTLANNSKMWKMDHKHVTGRSAFLNNAFLQPNPPPKDK